MAELKSYHDLMYDQQHKYLVTCNPIFYAVERGILFRSSFGAQLGNAETGTVLIRTGANNVHFNYEISAKGIATYDFREGATISASGTLLPTQNKNRGNTSTILTTVRSSATVTESGTLLTQGALDKYSGGAEPSMNYWVLKSSTDYILRVVSGASGNECVIKIGLQECH